MPHVMPALCSLMKTSERKYFSISCAQLGSTSSFSRAKHGQGKGNWKNDSCASNGIRNEALLIQYYLVTVKHS